jgi:hypothetical protein
MIKTNRLSLFSVYHYLEFIKIIIIDKFGNIPRYFSGLLKRARFIGILEMMRELYYYNKYYTRIIKKSNVPIKPTTYLFNIATYTEIGRHLPELSKNEIMKYVPITMTHAIYWKLDIDRRKVTCDKYKMYLRMHDAHIQVPEIYYISDKNRSNV